MDSGTTQPALSTHRNFPITSRLVKFNTNWHFIKTLMVFWPNRCNHRMYHSYTVITATVQNSGRPWARYTYNDYFPPSVWRYSWRDMAYILRLQTFQLHNDVQLPCATKWWHYSPMLYCYTWMFTHHSLFIILLIWWKRGVWQSYFTDSPCNKLPVRH